MTIIDHVSLAVHDLASSTSFFEAALAPLGLELLYREPGFVAFGVPGGDDFALHQANTCAGGAHVAFAASTRSQVEHFWTAALGAGGDPIRPPALHPEYHQNYYAAFIRDAEGNNIEAVLHEPS